MARTRLRTESSQRRPVRRRAATLVVTAAATALTGATLAAIPAAADPVPERTIRQAVALVNFRDSSLSDAAVVHTKAARQFFGADGSVATYYAANSGNRLAVVPAQGDGVFGPFTIDVDSTKCDPGKMNDLARKALPADLKYDHVAIVMPGTGACPWWGLGSMPGPTTWFQEGAINGDDYTAALHEFGHNMGFNHEGRELCPVGKFTGCSGDGHSHITPMGGGGQGKGLSAPELIGRNWLSSERIVKPKETTTVHLTPLHAPAAAGGTRAVDIPLGTGGDRLVVFRVNGGNYSAAVNLRNNTEDKKKMVGSFTGTEPMTDLEHHISLSYSKTTADGVDVHIDLAHGGTPATAAASAGTAKTPAATAGRPTQTQLGDTAHDLGAKTPPTRSAAPATHRPADRDLAETGSDHNVMVPALIGTALIGASAAFLLRRRHQVRTRRH
jgi:LPXTG-motif cell wall-anchored protein